MASQNGKQDGDRDDESHGPRECMPCRGTGRVISNLGGTTSKLPCPWCEGGGVRLHGIDAQNKWLGAGTGTPASARAGSTGGG